MNKKLQLTRHLTWELLIVFLFIVIALSVYEPVLIPGTIKDGIKPSSKELPDQTLCQFTQTGWSCVLTKDHNWFSDSNWSLTYEPIRDQFSEVCQQQNGFFRSYGYGTPNYDHFCDWKFSDAGKKCLNSATCQGKCIIEGDGAVIETMDPVDQLNSKLEGTCAPFELRTCDWYIELNDEKIFENNAICD
jgi:hypothetical protein